MRCDVKAIRRKCRMTQGQFAKMLGISIPTLCRQEAKCSTDAHSAYILSQIDALEESKIEEIKGKTKQLPGRLIVEMIRGGE